MELRNPARVITQRYVDTQSQDATDHWSDGSNCRTVDPDLMYGKSWRAAVKVCGECAVQAECRVVGMGEQYGTWGGLTEHERKNIRANVPEWLPVDGELPVLTGLDDLVNGAEDMAEIIEGLPANVRDQPFLINMLATRWDNSTDSRPVRVP